MFLDGTGRTIMAESKEQIMYKYKNVKSVFKMGRKT
jgi:hypothetical protein